MAPKTAWEGWYTDPFDRHEARWFSAGTPSRLVRDGAEESYDPPPNEPFRHQPEPIQQAQPSDGNDVLRADAAEEGIFDQEKTARAVFDIWDIYGPRR